MSNVCKKAALAVEETIKILQPKWTLQIVHELQAGKRRFNELSTNLGGVNPRTLCQRLRELEEHGIVHRDILSAIPPHVEYSLTCKGQALHVVIDSMESWGRQWGTAANESSSAVTAVATS